MMRNNRKLKLKLSNSNVKNFPIDFFEETLNSTIANSSKKSDINLNSSMNNSRNMLRPLNLAFNKVKLWSPKVNSEMDGEIPLNSIEINELISPIKCEDSRSKFK